MLKKCTGREELGSTTSCMRMGFTTVLAVELRFISLSPNSILDVGGQLSMKVFLEP